MFNFQFFNPTNVIFGVGSLSKLVDVVKGRSRNVMLLSGQKHAKDYGVLDNIMQSLKGLDINISIIDGIKPNPQLIELIEITNKLKSKNFDCIVALGGGSVMDAAKLISLILTHNEEPWEYRVTGKYSVPKIENRLIPVITIPTTAGTGSEISPAALAVFENRKEVFFSPYMYPRTAIIDPSLTLSLPINLTAQIGMDAFIQSMEAYVSSSAQPFSDIFAIESMKLVFNNLPTLMKKPEDITLRTQLSLAGYLSCYAIGQAGVGAVHALADPLSGRYNIGHGLALCILVLQVMKINLNIRKEKFSEITNFLGGNRALSIEDNANLSVELVEHLLEKIDLNNIRLSRYGIKESDISLFAAEADNPDMSTNPQKLSKDQCIMIYKGVL